MGHSVYKRLRGLRVSCTEGHFTIDDTDLCLFASCDNCLGSFEDISTRMDQFQNRLFVNGWDRTKAVWTVPQGFGNES